MKQNEQSARTWTERKYEYGFTTDVETEIIPQGLINLFSYPGLQSAQV